MLSTRQPIPGRRLIVTALKMLYVQDRHLLALPAGAGGTSVPLDRRTHPVRANERAIAARLAVHVDRELTHFYPDYTVDVEYCRVGGGTNQKRGPGDRAIYPDLVVHRRGHRDHHSNAVVVEMKRGLKDAPDPKDVAKITAMTKTGWMNGTQDPYALGLILQVDEDRAKLFWSLAAANEIGSTRLSLSVP